MNSVQRRVKGEIVDVRFSKRRGVYMYEFKMLTPEGRYRHVYVNAKTIRILRK